MSQFDWQTTVALILVAIASAYLAWRAYAAVTRRKSTGCGTTCAQCPSTQEVSLITAQQLANSLTKRGRDS